MQFYAAVCEKMAALQKDNGEYLPNNCLSLGDGFNIKDGDTLDFAYNIPQVFPLASWNEDNFDVLVKGFDNVSRPVTVSLTCTVSDLKLHAANIPENYLWIHQQHLDALPLRLEHLQLSLHSQPLMDENLRLIDLLINLTYSY